MRTLVLLLVLLAGRSASAAPAVKLAVVPLDASPDLTFTGRSLSEAIAAQARGAGYEVTAPEAVERTLGRAGAAALVRCGDDERCLGERGAALGVDRVVAGWIQRAGDRYVVTLVHVDVADGRRVAAFRRDVPIAARKLRADVLAAVPGLLAGKADEEGSLSVTATVPGATVLVDDRAAGATPLTLRLAAGRHKVQVSKAGFVPAEPVWVEVAPGGEIRHTQRLHEVPPRDRPNNGAVAAESR
jgi:TolB-like protein